MKTKFYLLLFIAVCFSVNMQAQLPSDFKTMLIEEWKNNSWRNDTRTTSDYDSNGNLIKQTTQFWDTLTNQWKDDAIFEYTNNADGTVREMTMKIWDDEENKMIVASKTVFTYTAAKKTATSTTQMDIGLGMMDFMKTTYNYNSGGQLEKEVTQSLNIMSMALENSQQILYEYNPDGTEYRTVDQNYDGTTLTWVNEGRNTHTYNSAKLVEKTLTEEFLAGVWANSSQTSFSYNTNATYKEIVEEVWESGSQKWVFDWKEIFSYSDGKMHQVLEQEWNTSTIMWADAFRVTFGYLTTGMEDQIARSNGDLRVYPNPFNDRLEIDTPSAGVSVIEIFNPDGKLMFMGQRQGNKIRIETGSLKDGVYVLRLKTGDAIRTAKIIKQRVIPGRLPMVGTPACKKFTGHRPDNGRSACCIHFADKQHRHCQQVMSDLRWT